MSSSSAAAEGRHVPDVRRIVVEVAEEPGDRSHRAEASGADDVERAQPLRVRAHHERFFDPDAGAVAHRDELRGFGPAEADRLFAEDVLARFGGANRPRHVQVVGEGNVDGVDVGIGEELVVRAVRLRDLQCGGGVPRPAGVTGRNRVDLRPRAALHRRDDFFCRDLRDAEHAPPDLVTRPRRSGLIAHVDSVPRKPGSRLRNQLRRP